VVASRKKAGQWYPEQPPKFTEPGIFAAWIAGTHRPNGVSAAAWEIRGSGGDQRTAADVVPSDGTSDMYRAYVAAAVGVLEALFQGSRVVIYCRNEAVVKGINDWVEGWRDSGWKKSDTRQAKAEEIWKQFLKIRQERDLTVTAAHCRKDENAHGETFDRLQDRARAEGDLRH
jgi:ribonuclease HI